MKKNNLRRERGSVEVEATIILPIAILSVILLLYLSLFMFQKANLQACLETTLLYYKNQATDCFVKSNGAGDFSYQNSENVVLGVGNSYSATKEDMAEADPYVKIFNDPYDLEKSDQQEAFKEYFNKIAGKMLFDDQIDFQMESHNYVIYKQMEVSVTQTLEAPIDFSILGVDNKMEITAHAKMNMVDHDDTIRNVDYVIDIVEDTKLGEMMKDIAGKISEAYGKLKEVLKVQG